MNIPETADLTVRSWAKIVFEFYSSTVSKLPAPKLSSPDGKYTYTLNPPNFMRKVKWKYSVEAQVLMTEQGISTQSERFCYMNNLIPLCEDANRERIWNPHEPIRKQYVISFLAGLIRNYQKTNFIFPTAEDFSNDIRLLLQNNIFEGISETNLNDWLDSNITIISVADAEILVENTKKFFSQYLA